MAAPAIAPISLDSIRAEIQAQPRAAMLTDEVAHYSEAMVRGDTFPPLVVYFDGTVYWLADGFHRYHAARGLGLAKFACDVRNGGLRDAVLHSVGANEAHGIRRTNEDKRRAVKRLLDDVEWCQWSNREIARRCAVDDKTVAALRPAPDVTAEIRSEPRTYTTKHGSISQMATAAIGRREPLASQPLPAFFRDDSSSAPKPASPTPSAFFTQGDGSIFNDLTDVRRMVRGLPEPERAVANFPDRVRHAFSATDFDELSDWFARAAAAWRQHEEATRVAAE